MITKFFRAIKKFGRWLLSAPFQELPSEFGDPVPPELRRFEFEEKEILHHPNGKAQTGSFRDIPPSHSKHVH